MPIIRMILFLILSCFCTISFSQIDINRYMPFDKIEPGMEGYALSVYSGTEIDKFPVRVVSVVRDYRPGKNAIFVMGTDERFKHTGPVQGCSGSPVVIDGKIVGALAFGWSFVKDPLYGVTPIEEMLEISERLEKVTSKPPAIELGSGQIDFSAICRQTAEMAQKTSQSGPMGLNPLDVPVVSSFDSNVCGKLREMCGITLYSGVTAGEASNPAPGSCMPNFEAGSVVCIPMVDGDIKMAAVGTVTDVVGDKVYAFGHAFEAAGKAELPMACGMIHMVVANQISSFKLGQSTQTIGTIVNDSATGIFGKIGEMPTLIPFNITVNRSDNPEAKRYNCTLAKHKLYTPNLIQASIAGAALAQADVPAEHTVSYSCRIGVKGYEPIEFSNVSSGQSIGDPIFETAGIAAVLLNNRYRQVDITGIDFSIDIREGESTSEITLVETDDIKVKPGEEIELEIFTEEIRSKERKYKTTLEIPEDLEPGRYQIVVSGAEQYQNFVYSSRQYKAMVKDIDSLLSAIRDQIRQPRNGLYVYMRTSQEGISIGTSPLEGLPESKISILSSPKRNYNVNPIFDWIERHIETGNIVTGQNQINILVEEK